MVASALFWVAYLQVERSTREAANERLQSVVLQLSGTVQSQFRLLERRLRTIAAAPAVRTYLRTQNARTRAAALAALHGETPPESTVADVELWDSRGRRVLADGPAAARLSEATSARLLALSRGPDSAAVGAFRAMGDTVVYPTVALIDDHGRALGALVQWRRVSGTRTREQIARLIGSEAALYFGGPGGVWTDQAGIVSPPPVDVSHLVGVIQYVRPGSGSRLGAAAAVAGVPWVALLEFPEDVVRAPVRRFLGRMAAVSAFFIVLGLLAAWMLSRRITGPLHELTAAAGAMGAGDHSLRVNIGREDELGRLASAFNDMAGQIQVQIAERAASEEQWRLVFEGNPHPMWVFDRGTLRFLAVNDEAIRQYGYSREEFLAMTLKDIRPPGDVPTVLENAALAGEGPEAGGTWRHRRKDGSEIDVQISAHALSFAGRRAELVLAHDVTAHKALEAQFRQAQKMEAVGRLAGGIAHDFNNLLTAIMSYAELIRGDLAAGDRSIADVDEIVRAAKQAHGLTRQLLAFSRRQVIQPSVVSPNTVVTDIQRMLTRLIGDDVHLTTDLDPRVGNVRIDPGQLEQVLMNLAVNARDAMPEGGRLTIRTARADLDDISSRLHGVPKGGHYVVISVTDTGFGMTQETQARIFEPLFTTKAEGTGLGLATVYGIVTQNGGHVRVYSERGEGSTFRVYLSRLADEAEGAAPVEVPELLRRGTETILLVEDDAAVRTATAEALERQGYTVLVASSTADALALAERHKNPVHLIVADVVMPELGGSLLVNRLRALRPGLKALLISGYTADAVTRRGLVESGVPFLEKPFTLGGLAGKVREALDAA